VPEVTLADFARSFGTRVSDIPADCRELIAQHDFGYEVLAGEERDKVILDILKRIDSDQLTVVGEERKGVWEKGWSENLQGFLEKNYDLDELTPKYYHPGRILRFRGDYITTADPYFEYNFFKVLRLWLFRTYLKDVESVYEFGCGPGHNLVALARLYPGKKLNGLDWAEASRDLANKIAEVYHYHITGHLFDMFHPDEKLLIEKNSAVMTFGALEQLGHNYGIFLDFLIKKSPALCLNVEPLRELYHEENLLDYLAMRYQDKRHYLTGYLDSLKRLETEGKIKILKMQRMSLGNANYDGWSFVVWRPGKISSGL